jgi:homoserine dehydrogenase
MKKNLKLGVFGFGCVGQGLFHVLNETKGLKAEIKKIVVKHPEKERPIPKDFFSYDRTDILNDPEIDVVVELIDDAEAAFEILKESLQKGKAVVTANKKMLAEHLEEIHQLQQQYQTPVLYESAVCASIPIIRNLEEYYDNDLIKSIEGILNGSTNYILTKVFEEKKSYSDALMDAQRLGFAESDPSLDVKAFDPKFKLAILVAHAFGVFVKPETIINFGIDRVRDTDLKYARENGFTIKLIGRAFKKNGTVYGLVAPQLVDEHHPLANVRNEYNAVLVEGAFAEKQMFIGKGAGSYPTGSAVLSDISALTYGYQYEYKKINQNVMGFNGEVKFSNEASVEAIVSFHGGNVSSRDFVMVHSGYRKGDKEYIRGEVKLDQIAQWAQKEGVSVLLTDGAQIRASSVNKGEPAAIASLT